MVLALLLAAAPHLALSAGAGLAYGMLGAHAELRIGPVAPFFGVGANIFTDVYGTPPAYAAGVRIVPWPDGGPLFSAHVAWSSASVAGAPRTQDYFAFDATYFVATVGWRQRLGSVLFLEFGAGLGIVRNHEYGASDPPSPTPNSCTPPGGQRFAQDYCRLSHKLTGDVDLAVGFEF